MESYKGCQSLHRNIVHLTPGFDAAQSWRQRTELSRLLVTDTLYLEFVKACSGPFLAYQPLHWLVSNVPLR